MKGYLKLLVLSKLRKNSMSGTDVMNMIEITLGKKPSSGSVYPLLKELTNQKYIVFEEIGKSKVYSITEVGKDFILNLIQEKKKALIMISEVLNYAEDITGLTHKDAINVINNQKDDIDSVLYNVDILVKITSLLIVLEKKNKDDLVCRDNTRSILKATYEKLQEVLENK